VRKFLLILLVALFWTDLFATDNFHVGARSAGMANAGVFLRDIWSSHHNQAGLAYLTKPSLGFYFEQRFAQKELSMTSVAGALPLFNGTAGINLAYWGYEKFNTSKFGFSFSKQLGTVFSAGIQLDYFNTYLAEDVGNKGTVLAEAGLLAQPVPNFFIGAHIYNPTRARLADYNDERLPTILRFGMGYNFADKLLIGLETEKNITEKAIFKTGLEYKYLEKLYLRAGISTNPIISSFGIGYKLKDLAVDLAFSRHDILGLIPHFSVNYSF